MLDRVEQAFSSLLAWTFDSPLLCALAVITYLYPSCPTCAGNGHFELRCFSVASRG